MVFSWGRPRAAACVRRAAVYSTAAVPGAAVRAARYGEKDVWAIFTPLAQKHHAVNLGQGFPNMPAPQFVKDAACTAIEANLNQYAPSRGVARLRNSIAQSYGPAFGRPLDAETEVLVTQGANQGIAVAMQAFVEPGDEVLLIEPYFDIYKPCVEVYPAAGCRPSHLRCGGSVTTAPLRLGRPLLAKISANDWQVDFAELEGKITSRTKGILINNPHNPTGKMFSLDEMQQIALLALKHNLLVFSDDVYDRLYYTEPPLRIASFPGMWDRTVTFASGGKTFGVTGWRIGWAIGPASLLKYMLAVHARTVFTTPTPLQEAVASGLEHCERSEHFERTRLEYRRLRDRTVDMFTELGLPVAVPEGSFFMMVDMSRLKVDLPLRRSEESSDPTVMEPRDYAICRWLTTEIGVTAIPPSAFYQPENKHLAGSMVRVCFCKTDETLDTARERLQRIKKYL